MIEPMLIYDRYQGKGIDIDIITIPGRKTKVVVEQMTAEDFQ